MYKHLFRLALVVGLLMLAHAMFFWGGVGLTPSVGDWVRFQAPRQANTLGVAFYTSSGVQTFGLVAPDAAKAYAHEQVGEVMDNLAGAGKTAPEAIRDAMPASVRISHYGTPIAFVLALILNVIRPKPIRSLGR